MLNCFCFSLFYKLWDCSNLWITSMLWMILLLFLWNLCSILSDECFNQQWAISLFIFLCVFMYYELWTTPYDILYACITVRYSSLNIILPPGDRLGRIIWLSIVVICLWFRSEMGNKMRGKNLRITLWILCHLYRFALRLGTCISYIK